MRRTTATLLAALVALGGLGGLGCAHKQKKADVDVLFIKYDTNRDGVITRDEFAKHWKDQVQADKAWKQLDTAGAGSLNRTQASDVPFDVWSDIESQQEP